MREDRTQWNKDIDKMTKSFDRSQKAKAEKSE